MGEKKSRRGRMSDKSDELTTEDEVKVLTREELDKLVSEAIDTQVEEEESREKLKQVHTIEQQYDNLKDEMAREIFAIHMRYEQQYKSLLTQRSQLTTMKEFWKTVLVNSELGLNMIQKRDLDSLSYLTDVQCELWSRESLPDDTQPSEGFTLSFHFSPNPYFENSVLQKTYFYDKDMEIVGRAT